MAQCPPATQDIVINLNNRKKAINEAMYGPLNPSEPNEEYWVALGKEWNVSAEEAKKQRCGNCAVFIQTPSMKSCIESGLTDNNDEFEAIDSKGDLGYCEIFDFKCASARTCRAWVAGGPVTEEESVVAAGSSAKTPAPKKDRIKGSKVNPKGSASSGKIKSIKFSQKIEDTLRNKVEIHNKKAPDGRRATLGMLKAVYRRGSGAYSTSHRPGMTRDQWAMGRVNAFLHLLSAGRPKNSTYISDNDLLPTTHPRSTKKEASVDLDYAEYLSVTLKNYEDYASPEEAIIALAEFSDFGYDIHTALRAAWLRGVKNDENPYDRAFNLAALGYRSIDADLLPTQEKG